MSRRKSIAWAVALATGAAGVAAGPAGAAATPKNATLTAVGGPIFEKNRQVADAQRFNKDVVRMRSGGTLTLRNRTGQPHTFSVVKRSDLPGDFEEMDACFGPEGACGQIAALHGVTEETQDEPPPNLLVN